MEKINFIYFVLGAGSLFVGLLAQPYVRMGWQWLKSLIPHRKPQQVDTNVEYLLCKVEELEEQINNLIKHNQHRRNNIRNTVRDYLKELQNGK